MPIPTDLSLVDAAILIIVVAHVFDDVRRGYLAGVLDLVGVALALVAAFWLYVPAAQELSARFGFPYALAKPVAFGVIWLVSDLVLSGVLRSALGRSVARAARSSTGRLFGVVTGVVRGLAVSTLMLGVVAALPAPEPVTQAVRTSRIAPFLQQWVEKSQVAAASVLDDAVQHTIGLLTVRPESGERVDLPFRVDAARIDATTEQRMLEMVNAERTSAGAPPLVVDPTIRDVARSYSQQMLREGFFSHIDPNGRTPFERMRGGGVRFAAAGENLALAPTVALAHDGLMNSPGHRANILNPRYRRVGIGVADGGMHGKIYTQNFAD